MYSAAAQTQTVWTGVYSEAQAYRGEKVADTTCIGCHGPKLDGGDRESNVVQRAEDPHSALAESLWYSKTQAEQETRLINPPKKIDAIADAMNTLGGTGLWDENDGFYYDQLHVGSEPAGIPLKVRSMVGLIPLFAVEVLHDDVIDRLPGFKKRMQWFLTHRADLAQVI